MLVVPGDVVREFLPDGGQPEGNNDRSCALILHRFDKSLDDGDTSVLANGSVAVVDLPSSAPTSVCVSIGKNASAFSIRSIQRKFPLVEMPGVKGGRRNVGLTWNIPDDFQEVFAG